MPPTWAVPGLFFAKRYLRIETKKEMVYVCMAQVAKRACLQRVEGVDTLQAAEPSCSVSYGPMKRSLKTSVSGH